MTEEIRKQELYVEKIKDASQTLSDISVEFFKVLNGFKASQPSLEKDNSPLLMEQMKKVNESIDKLKNQLSHRKECQQPPVGSLSKKIIYICLAASVTSSLLTAFSMHLLNDKRRYELGPKAIQTCRKGRMLEKAWPKLTPKEREKISGVPEKTSRS